MQEQNNTIAAHTFQNMITKPQLRTQNRANQNHTLPKHNKIATHTHTNAGHGAITHKKVARQHNTEQNETTKDKHAHKHTHKTNTNATPIRCHNKQ